MPNVITICYYVYVSKLLMIKFLKNSLPYLCRENDVCIQFFSFPLRYYQSCSRVVYKKFLLVFSVYIDPVKPCKKNILMVQLRWHVAMAIVCRWLSVQ
jgi:hypothetical protein